MDDEQKKPASNGAPPWILFAVPAILAAIGVYFALTRPAPNEAQARIRAQAGIAAPILSEWRQSFSCAPGE